MTIPTFAQSQRTKFPLTVTYNFYGLPTRFSTISLFDEQPLIFLK